MRAWMLAAAVMTAACGSGDSVSGPTDGGTKVLVGLAPVEEVQVRVGSPTTVIARVQGYLPDPCWTQTKIDQQWHGPWVNVWIVMQRPAASQCAQLIQPFEQEIEVPITTGPGTYYIRVNGVGREIRL